MQLQLLDSYRSFQGRILSGASWVALTLHGRPGRWLQWEGWGLGAQKHQSDISMSKLKEDQKLRPEVYFESIKHRENQSPNHRWEINHHLSLSSNTPLELPHAAKPDSSTHMAAKPAGAAHTHGDGSVRLCSPYIRLFL